MKNIYLLLFSVIVLLASCKKDDSSDAVNTTNPTSITPLQNATFEFLKVGNKWTYDYSTIFNDGTMTIEVISAANNKYRVSQIMDGGTPYSADWYVEGGYLKARNVGSADTNAKILYKANSTINDTWTTRSSSGFIYRKVVKLNDTIITAAGSFYDCVKIEETYSFASNTQYNYWSKKYGQVFQEGEASMDLTVKNF